MEWNGINFDLIPSDKYKWFNLAKSKAQLDAFGNACLDIPFIVLMKFEAFRTQDASDISRMLGQCSEAQIRRIKKVFLTYFPEDEEDFNQLLEIGKYEI